MAERQMWNDEDDAAYWADQERELTEPVDPMATYDAATDKLSRYRTSGDADLRSHIPALEATVARLRPLIEAQTAAFVSAEEAEWTRETTSERRAAWNAAVTGNQFRDRNGSPRLADIRKALGFDMATLKHHVTRHGL